jgi:hypothetical protein
MNCISVDYFDRMYCTIANDLFANFVLKMELEVNKKKKFSNSLNEHVCVCVRVCPIKRFITFTFEPIRFTSLSFSTAFHTFSSSSWIYCHIIFIFFHINK